MTYECISDGSNPVVDITWQVTTHDGRDAQHLLQVRVKGKNQGYIYIGFFLTNTLTTFIRNQFHYNVFDQCTDIRNDKHQDRFSWMDVSVRSSGELASS